jgi:hypothetical protein
MRVEGTTFPGPEQDLPDPDPLVLEPDCGSDLEVGRGGSQLPDEVGRVIYPLFDDVGTRLH